MTAVPRTRTRPGESDVCETLVSRRVSQLVKIGDGDQS